MAYSGQVHGPMREPGMLDLYLVQRVAGETRRAWPLKAGAQIVGRSEECEIVIDDGTISREHAELVLDDRTIRVIDLDSRNGTLVDNVRITSTEIRVGSVVQFGRILCGISYQPIQLTSTDETPSTLPYETTATAPNIAFLSERKQLVLRHLLDGLSEKEVAVKLAISPHTVHHHVTDLYRLFDVSSRGELLALFVRK